MNIAYLNLYSGSVNRGAETFVHEASGRLGKSHKVTVFQGGVGGIENNYKVEKVSISINWEKPESSGKLSRRLFIDYWSLKVAMFTLKSLPLIWKNRFDVVVPVNGGWQPAFIRILTWLYGGKMVISGQSGIGWDDRNNLWSFPDAFVALSTKAKKWAKKANPFVKSTYIPNGVDTNKFSKQGIKYKTKLKGPIVLCVAALTSTKRVELAIKAVSRMDNISLLIIGDGDLRDEIEVLGNKLLKDRFELVKLPFSEMPSVYRVSGVFTIPSESYYSFEIVLVEAMASGLPVVANKDEIRMEIVGSAGLLVDPTDIKTYAKKLQKALDTNWGDKPRKQAEKFSWDIIAKKYEKLFKDLIN